jgi:hypothetical protein
MKFKKYLTLFIFTAIYTLSFSTDDYAKSSYKSIRSMGMGGTNVASGFDESALLYNPALLKVMKGHKISLPSFAVSSNGDTFDLIDAMQDLGDDADKINDEQNMLKLLQAYLNGTTEVVTDDGQPVALNEGKNKIPDKYLRGEINSFTGFVVEGFGFGVFSNFKSNQIGLTGNKINPSVVVNGEGNVEIPVGVAFKVFDKVNLGVSVRGIASYKANSTLHYVELSDLSDDALSDEEKLSILNVEEAVGFGVNLGTVVELDKLNVAVSLRDPFSKVQTAKYVKNASNKYELKDVDKKSLPTNLSIGLSNKPYIDGKQRKFFWTVEVENLLNEDLNGDGYDDKSFFKKVHAGTEYYLLDTSWLDLKLRAGINQGYLTYGASVKLFVVEVEYANYTEELGPHAGMDKNKVNSLGMTMRF